MKPVIYTDRVALLLGDAKRLSETLPENSVDAVVCDPPYELAFMGKRWDASGIAYDADLWRAVLRVLKPGGHLLAFGGTRTYHRMTCAIEDAGFEIRDCVQWWYGTGFPKSKNISKDIDKLMGAKRPVIGDNPNHRAESGVNYEGTYAGGNTGAAKITGAGSPEAAQWEGWGTGLKPANEPIVLARKPLAEKSIARNVLKYSTGGLNIDGCRIGDEERVNPAAGNKPGGSLLNMSAVGMPQGAEAKACTGRWPANLILTHAPDCVIVGRETVKGASKSQVEAPRGNRPGGFADVGADVGSNRPNGPQYPDAEVDVYQCSPGCPVGGLGDPARFFYVTKPNKKEKNAGCEHLQHKTAGEVTGGRKEGSDGLKNPRAGAGRTSGAKNSHPTVKPIDLMRYLIRLITPPGGIVLDPFVGSGTTGIAAIAEGVDFIGVELSDEYIEIAKARIEHALKGE